MKPHAEAGLMWAKEVYRNAYANSNETEIAEAIALGTDPSTAHNYLDTNSPRNLPFGLVPHSRYAKELTAALAEKVGGVFIEVTGKLNGSDRDERRKILNCMAKMQNEEDPKRIDGLFAEIEKCAARARKEDAI